MTRHAWGLVVVASLAASIAPTSDASAQLTKSQGVITGDFYRFTSTYIVDGQEPLDFDIVVTCATAVTRYRGGSSSVLSRYMPNLVARRTQAGHAVMVAVPVMCAQQADDFERTNKPERLLPLAIWFDRWDYLDLGLGYWSEDAYENPKARLKFLGASLVRATREEWEAWRATQPENLVKREDVPGLGTSQEEWKAWGAWHPGKRWIARQCHGVARFKLTEKQREVVRKFWPAHRPRYWIPPEQQSNAVLDAVHGSGVPFGRNNKVILRYQYGGRGGWNQLLANRSGYVGQRIGHYPAEYYPFNNEMGYPFLSKELNERTYYYLDVDYEGGANKGFVSCYQRSGRYPKELAKHFFPDGAWPGRWPRLYRLDGQLVDQSGPSIWAGLFVVENDEYVFKDFFQHLGGDGGVE